MEKLSNIQIEELPEWLPIPDYPDYDVNCRKGLVRNANTLRVLKPSISVGYPRVTLYKDGKMCTKMVHRIVAEAAYHHYGISTDGLLVMHLDEERHNPRIDNLVLGTNKENLNFPKAKQRLSEAQKGEKSYWFGKRLSEETRLKMSDAHKGKKGYWFGRHRSEETRKKLSESTAKKAVGAYKNGELILTFDSTQEASRNGFHSGHVSACCTGKRRVHKGYFWKYL